MFHKSKTCCVLLFLIFITACSVISGSSRGTCRQGLCIIAKVVEPVRVNEPDIVSITVTSDKDIPDVGVSLQGVPVDGPDGWEMETRDIFIDRFGASWVVDLKANQPYTAVRTFRLLASEG